MTALDGLAYGDDPADGVVKGRRFIHSRLGVAFEAPEGFTLENTSQAVLGASGDGERRLLFDAADTPDGQSLEDVLRSTWTDTIEPGTPDHHHRERPARGHGPVQRQGMDLPPLGHPDRQHHLSPDHGHPRQQVRIWKGSSSRPSTASGRFSRTKRGGSGRSSCRSSPPSAAIPPQTLAARMPVDRPLERFLLLNGLDRNASLAGRALQDRRGIKRNGGAVARSADETRVGIPRSQTKAPEAWGYRSTRARLSFSRARFSI